jgi:OmpA-OmpF porin, OOP family
MGNLLDTLKGLASNELISAASKSMGESEGGISKAVGAILPSILGGVMNSNSSSHSMIGDLLGQAGGNNNMIGDLIGGITSGKTDSPSMGIGGSLIKGLFGDKLGGIANLISNFSGIKSSSSSSLLGIGGSLIASFLGKKMLGEGLNFGGIMSWLGGHKSEIESAVPSGFSSLMSGIGGVASGAGAAASKAAGAVGSAMSGGDDDRKGGGMNWLLPIILLGVLGAFLWYWLKGAKKEEATTEPKTEVHDETKPVDAGQTPAKEPAVTTLQGALNAAGDWIATKGAAKQIKLDNNVTIETFEGSLEDRFYNFIKDPAATPGKDIWFNFEDLLFESGKSTLKAGSEKQLNNTVEILKAYPNVKIKLGGYTDNVGDSTKNVTLSEARAKTVYNQIIGKAVPKTSFDDKPYEGYGPQHPVGDNNTPEGKAQNRRISISVRAK